LVDAAEPNDTHGPDAGDSRADDSVADEHTHDHHADEHAHEHAGDPGGDGHPGDPRGDDHTDVPTDFARPKLVHGVGAAPDVDARNDADEPLFCVWVDDTGSAPDLATLVADAGRGGFTDRRDDLSR
jgi:hypothetical protein